MAALLRRLRRELVRLRSSACVIKPRDESSCCFDGCEGRRNICTVYCKTRLDILVTHIVSHYGTESQRGCFFQGFCFNKEQNKEGVCVCLEEGGRKWAWRGKTDLRIKEATEYKINHLLLLQKKSTSVYIHTDVDMYISQDIIKHGFR